MLERLRDNAMRKIIDEDQHVLFFSPDGKTWSIQDLSEVVVGDVSVRLVVGEDLVLVLAGSPEVTAVWSGDPPE